MDILKKLMGNTGTVSHESMQISYYMKLLKAYISNDIGTTETEKVYKLDI